MGRLFQPLSSAARTGFVLTSWALAVLVFVQVYYAGHAVLVQPGDWGPHTTLGHMFGPTMFAMLVFSLVGRMPVRFPLYSVGLFGLYSLQYLFLYWPSAGMMPMRALHPVNALVMLLFAVHIVRSSQCLVVKAQDVRKRLPAAAVVVLAVSLVIGFVTISARDVSNRRSDDPATTLSLADATEGHVPGHYKAMENPVAKNDSAAVAAGRQLAGQNCAACHGARLTGNVYVGAPNLTHAAGRAANSFSCGLSVKALVMECRPGSPGSLKNSDGKLLHSLKA